MRRLSSTVLTFAWKTFFPAAATGGFTLVAFGRGSNAAGCAVAVACLAVFGALTWRVKSVKLDRDELVIAGYWRSIRVPLHRIASVSGSTVLSPDRVWIRFTERTHFGREIVFYPAAPRWYPGFSVHPLAVELSALSVEAKIKHAREDGQRAARSR